jgi:hypothetical protein
VALQSPWGLYPNLNNNTNHSIRENTPSSPFITGQCLCYFFVSKTKPCRRAARAEAEHASVHAPFVGGRSRTCVTDSRLWRMKSMSRTHENKVHTSSSLCSTMYTVYIRVYTTLNVIHYIYVTLDIVNNLM